jgi:quercetin dioxygenase-like cupin family protein
MRSHLCCIGILVLGAVVTLPTFAQSSEAGHATPLDHVQFHAGKKLPCLSSAPETGDPNTGPSTEILKASKDCVVPWHYHTAEEQLFVAGGAVLTEMEGMPAATLERGGFAVMRGKQKHQFTCRSADPCILFVAFDQKYDIVWVDKAESPPKP